MTPRVLENPEAQHVGRRLLLLDEVPSTNDVAAGEPDGTAVIAKFQTAGRGQYGRVWQCRPGASLLLSVVVYPPPNLHRPVVLTAWAAVAIGDAILELTGVQARVKWPNDLLVRGKKVCGILIEQAGGNPLRTVVGVGLNLNQSAAEFADAELPAATSLAEITGLRKLDEEYARLIAGETVALEADWKWRVGLLGRTVVVEFADGSYVSGRLLEMGFDGLVVEGLDTIRPEFVRHLSTGPATSEPPHFASSGCEI
jgi:BirA family biotin operon repressor/biotin-[acetyl-CoA-carboxylase] ligase